MTFKYCRIQGRELAINTKTGKGIFSMLNQMVTDGVMDEEDVGLFKEIDSGRRYGCWKNTIMSIIWFLQIFPVRSFMRMNIRLS